MQDPFADKSNNRLQREVQVWMAGLACLLVAFLYLAVKRMAGPNDEIPAHILQSGVAHVTAPIERDPDSSKLLNAPKLSRAPSIPDARFASKSVSNPIPKRRAQPSFNFPSQREPARTFSSAPKPMMPKTNAAPQSRPNDQFPLPQPKMVAAPKSKSPAAKTEADAEALGRRRARQLAAMTSGLPKRLNQIQSSIQQASAELPAKVSSFPEKTTRKDNSFAPAKFPPLPIAKDPDVAKPDAAQPTVESSHPVKPIGNESFPIKPSLRPAPQPDAHLDKRPSAIPRPAEKKPERIAPTPNAFQPMPPVKPLPTASSLQAKEPSAALKPSATRVNRMPKPLRPAAVEQPPSAENQSTDTVRRLPATPVSSKQHIVQAGDSFFTIAQQHYGDGQWFRALRLANQSLIENHDGLQAGMSLSIPTTEELARQFPDQAFRSAAQQPSEAQRRIYETQAGDTLFDIARRKTGQGARFSEIIEANKFLLPAQIRASDKLPADLRLVLPESTLQ